MNQSLKCTLKYYSARPKGQRNPFRNGRTILLRGSCRDIIKKGRYEQ